MPTYPWEQLAASCDRFGAVSKKYAGDARCLQTTREQMSIVRCSWGKRRPRSNSSDARISARKHVNMTHIFFLQAEIRRCVIFEYLHVAFLFQTNLVIPNVLARRAWF